MTLGSDTYYEDKIHELQTCSQARPDRVHKQSQFFHWTHGTLELIWECYHVQTDNEVEVCHWLNLLTPTLLIGHLICH